jgi:glyoxylase I family protein
MVIEHLAFNVADPVAMAEWYTRHLGMRVVRRVAEAPFTHFLADESGRVVLEFYHHVRAPVPDYAALDPLVLHIAFTAADMHQAEERLLKAGATRATEVTITPSGDQLVFLRDPWGLAVQLVKRVQPLMTKSD